MQDFFLKTDRLTMRICTAHSLSNWYSLQSDPDVIKYLGDGKPRDKQEIEKNLHKAINHFNQYNFSYHKSIFKFFILESIIYFK